MRFLATGVLLCSARLLAQDGLVAPAEAERPYELMVGDPAPPLAVAKWYRGEPIAELQPGTVYVIELWATWCGPCIAGMPHLSELQGEYAEDGVRIVGVNIWDEPDNIAPFLAEPVSGPGGERTGAELMGYSVAVEAKDDPKDERRGVMVKTWMEPAGRSTIPCAFLIDEQLRIAWIGHPSEIDRPLAQVVAGTYDIAAAERRYLDQALLGGRIDHYLELFRAGKYEAAYALGRELVEQPMSAAQLNLLAWGIVDPARTPQVQDLALALRAAERANELTKSQSPHILDTLARVHHDRGDLDQAVHYQQLALNLAEGPLAEELATQLEEYRTERIRQATSKNASGSKGP